MMSVEDWAKAVLALIAGLCLSFLLARAGEPQSLWLWRDALGLLP